MAVIRERLAPARDLLPVFSACAFPIYMWSILNLLHKVPAWLMQFTAWDLVGVVAYILMFTLIETVSVFLALVLLAAVLPKRFLRERFVAQAGMLVLLSAASVALVRFSNFVLPNAGPGREVAFAMYMGSVALFYLCSVAVSNVLVRRHKKLEDAICALADRLTTLSFVYVATSLLSVFVVILRNA